jgi:Yip1 domain
MGLVSRFIGVITSPRATFQAIAAHPRWLGMMVLTALIIATCAALPMTTPEGQQAALDQQLRGMESFGVQVNDQMYEQMQRGAGRMPYTTFASILVMTPIIGVIVAGILFGVFTMLGGQATFKQLFAVYVHTGVVSAVGQLFTGPLNYFRGSVSGATNLAVFLPMIDEQSYLGKLLGMIDIFIIWWLIVCAIGLGVLYKRRTQPIAFTLFGIYAVIILVVAAVMTAFGRS